MKKRLSVLLVLAMLSAILITACGNKAETKTTENAKDAVTTQADKAASTEAPVADTANVTEAKADAPQASGELTKVRVAYMPNMGSASAVMSAIEYGHFKDQGLEVELTQFTNGPDEIASMASGDIDISQIGHGAHKLAIEGKALIFQMDATSLADAVVGNKDRGVNTIADLKGKKIASSLGTSADIILRLALQDAGLNDSSDVEIIEMDPAGVVPAMTSGQIDACATWSPSTVTIAKTLGDKAVTLADNTTYIDKATFPSSFITTEAYAKEHKDILVRFAAAIQKAQDERINRIDDVAKIVAAGTETNEEIMLEAKNEGNWQTSGTKFFKEGLADGTVKKFYENQQQIFLNANVIKEQVPVENYIRFDIMEEANKLALGE